MSMIKISSAKGTVVAKPFSIVGVEEEPTLPIPKA